MIDFDFIHHPQTSPMPTATSNKDTVRKLQRERAKLRNNELTSKMKKVLEKSLDEILLIILKTQNKDITLNIKSPIDNKMCKLKIKITKYSKIQNLPLSSKIE